MKEKPPITLGLSLVVIVRKGCDKEDEELVDV